MYTIEQFGVDRVMFASNFPMDKSSSSYTVLWNAYKRMTAGMPLADRKKLPHDNAARFYRLESGRVPFGTKGEPVDFISAK
jgi:predicted TIM-barrel fold metal-dependent hydrolase